MRRTAPLSFGRSQAQVAGMMEQGTAFARVEDAIDAAKLSQEHKAALWLLAWSLRDHGPQRPDPGPKLVAVGTRDWGGS